MHYIIQSYNYMINILCRFCCCMWHGCSKIKQWSWHIKPFHCTISWTYQWQNRKLYSYHIIISISYHIISYHIISYHIIISISYHTIIISYYHHHFWLLCTRVHFISPCSAVQALLELEVDGHKPLKVVAGNKLNQFMLCPGPRGTKPTHIICKKYVNTCPVKHNQFKGNPA